MTTNLETSVHIPYDEPIEAEIQLISALLSQIPALRQRYHLRWLAIQLLEGDQTAWAEVSTALPALPSLMETSGQTSTHVVQLKQSLNSSLARLQQHYDHDLDIVLADYRYRFVNQVVRQVLTRAEPDKSSFSDRLDQIVTHRLLGLPIFLFLMWAVFKLTADVSAPYLDWVDGLISGPLTRWSLGLLVWLGLGQTWLASLVVDGVIAGVGGILVFVPVLMMLYLALALLEDSGYMARAAFVMDRFMNKIGLHGKSFLPLIVGFGCTVPALYATRTLENEKDRLLTGLLVPFMSCGARLPVYVLFAAIFFPAQTGLVIFGLYLLGIMTAILVGLILKQTLFKTKNQTPLVMELPPYRWPSPRGLWQQIWHRTAAFIHNAATLILLTSIIFWFLMAIPAGRGQFAQIDLGESAFAHLSQGISPLFAPLGFDSWQSSGALMTGMVAKEVVISTLAQTHNLTSDDQGEVAPFNFAHDLLEIGRSFIEATGDTLKAIPLIVGVDLRGPDEATDPPQLMQAIRADFEASSGGHGALAALAFMAFILLYTPCVSAIAAERQEFGLKWTSLSVIGQFIIAWLAAFLVFQGGLFLGLG